MITSQQLVELFLLFAHSDATLLRVLTAMQSRFTVGKSWQFTLVELHLLATTFYHLPDLDYTLFRRTLFNSPINKSLDEIGAQIIIAHSDNILDKQRYLFEFK